MLDKILPYLPILIPILLLELTLMIVALRNLIKYPDEIRGSKVLWVLVIVFIQILGPIAYLTFGRDQG